MAIKTVDITVIGGGIVGLATALKALQDGFSVALLTPPDWRPSTPPQTWQSEVSALSPASLAFLEELGLIAALRPRAACFYQMQIFACPEGKASQKEKFSLQFQVDNGEPLGAIVENKLLTSELAAKVMPEVSHYVAEVKQVERGDSVWQLHWDVETSAGGIAAEGVLATRLLLAADGVHSTWRQRLAIPITREDYQQVALTAVFALEKSHRQTAWQVFLPGGPMALLPLAENTAVLVWSVPASTAPRYLLKPLVLEAVVNEYWSAQFAQLTLQSPLQATPLFALHAEYYAEGRFALLGDAAHRVHPLAGQGLNLSLRDLSTLAALWRRGQDPGDYRFLRRFERWRHLENAWLLKSFGYLNQLFSHPWLPLRFASAWGMAGINYLPIKGLLQKIAKGQSFYSEVLLDNHFSKKNQKEYLCM